MDGKSPACSVQKSVTHPRASDLRPSFRHVKKKHTKYISVPESLAPKCFTLYTAKKEIINENKHIMIKSLSLMRYDNTHNKPNQLQNFYVCIFC